MGLFPALASALFGKKKTTTSLATDQPLAPGPVEPLTPPKPPTVLPGANEALAQAAGQKQRKRATKGSALTRPTPPASSTMSATPKAPRSLIGY